MLEACAQPWSCSRMPCQVLPAQPLSADGGTGMRTKTTASLLAPGPGELTPSAAGPGGCDTVGRCFGARVRDGIPVPFCTLRLRMTLPHSRGHRDLVGLVSNSNRSLFQVFSALRVFHPTGVMVLGFTSSTHSRTWVQTSPWGVLRHPKHSDAKRHSPAVLCCTVWVLPETTSLNFFFFFLVSGPG